MRGNPNHTTRNLILTYLHVAGEPRPVRQITKYLHQMHRIDKGAVRTCLWRLVKEGKVTNPTWGYYQIRDD